MANYLTLKRQRLSTFNYTTDSDTAYHNQLNFTNYLTYTSLTIVSFCGSPTYQLSKHWTNILKPLTDKSRHTLLQYTDNFIDAIKTVQIPDDHKLAGILRRQITFHQHTTSTWPWLYEDRHQQITLPTTITHRRPYGPTAPMSDLNLLSVQR